MNEQSQELNFVHYKMDWIVTGSLQGGVNRLGGNMAVVPPDVRDVRPRQQMND